MIIADAEHRNAGLQSAALQALCGDGAIEGGERFQEMRVERGRAVPEARLTHWRLPSRAATATDTAQARRACAPARRRVARPRARRRPAPLRAPWDRRASAELLDQRF